MDLQGQIVDVRQSLGIWHAVSLGLVREAGRDLSQRQLAILLEVYLMPPPHTVRALASRLQVTKPVITRALDSLGGMDLLSRRRDPSDQRNVLITRTVAGSLFVEELGDLLAKCIAGEIT